MAWAARGSTRRHVLLPLAVGLLLVGPAPALAGLRLEEPRLAVERVDESLFHVELDVPRAVLRADAEGRVGRVEVAQASLHWRDAFGETGAARARLEGALERSATGWAGPATLELMEGEVSVDIVRAGAPTRVDARVVVDDAGFALRDARVRASALAIERVAGRDVDATLDFAQGAFDVESLRFVWFDGIWQASGRVSLDESTFAAKVKSTPTNLDDLALAVVGTRLESESLGAIALDGHVEGDWRDSSRWLDTLVGEGDIRMTGGTVASFVLFRAVWNALFDRIPGVSAKELDPRKASHSEIHHIAYPFELASSRLSSDSIEMITDDFEARGSGFLAFDGDIEYDLRIGFTREGRRKAFSMAHLPGKRAVPIPPIPVAVRGTFRTPTYDPDVSGVSFATLLALLGEVEGVSTALGKLVATPARLGMERLRSGDPAPEPEPGADPLR